MIRAAEALPEPVAGPMPQPEADAHYGYYGYGDHCLDEIEHPDDDGGWYFPWLQQ